MAAIQQKISSKVVAWDMEFRGEVLLEAVGPALGSASWLWVVFHLGLSRNLLFKVFARIWSPGGGAAVCNCWAGFNKC